MILPVKEDHHEKLKRRFAQLWFHWKSLKRVDPLLGCRIVVHLPRVVNILSFLLPSSRVTVVMGRHSNSQTFYNLNDTKLRFVLFVHSPVHRGRRENKLIKSYLLGHLHYYRILLVLLSLIVQSMLRRVRQGGPPQQISNMHPRYKWDTLSSWNTCSSQIL